MKRMFGLLLSLALLVGMIPVVPVQAATLTLEQLREKFPHGKYWNHVDNPGAANNNQDGYSDSPCPKHGNIGTSTQTCNGFAPHGREQSWQCMGFAEKLGYDATGKSPRDSGSGWVQYNSSSALSQVKPGDIVRNDGHSIYVTAVEGEMVTFADCNYYENCQIRWDATTTLTKLKSGFEYLQSAPIAQEPEESIWSADYAGTYQCTTQTSWLRIRSGAGTSYSILGSIPPGGLVQVTAATGSENSDWAQVTYNGITGFASMQYLKKVGLFYIHGFSTSLESSLGLNIYIRESDLQEGDYLEVYKNNADGTTTATKKILCADMEQRTVNGVACRRYSYTGIAAKEMNDKLTCVVKNAEGVAVSYTDNISIRDYAIDWAFDSVSATEKTLFIDMLNYGAEAQLLFGYNTENLANAGLSAEQLAYGSGALDVGDLNDYYVIPAEDTLLVGYSLTLVEKIQVNAYFHQDKIKALNEDTGKIHVKVSLTDYLGVEKTEDIPFADFIVRSSDGYDMYGVNVESLVAADLETGITLTLMNGEEVVGVYGYNVAAYCQDAVYGNYAEKDLAVALANYCKSAYNLFKN